MPSTERSGETSIVGVERERDRYRLERDLYRRLLELDRQTGLDALLREALALIVDVVGARQGYIELHADGERNGTPSWSIAHGFSAEALETVRARISRGIIGMAVATGQTIVTSSALLDPRFKARESVIRGRIEAVLCAPIGEDVPRGVVYLQGSDNARTFTEEDRGRAEIFARHLGIFADRLLRLLPHRNGEDALGDLRHRLRLDGVVGHSPALVAALHQAAALAAHDAHALVTGGPGSGKRMLARIVHESGRRSGGPFVAVGCDALPEALAETELFGSVTGPPVAGKVAAADGGTLYVSEVSALPSPVQEKIVRLVRSREYVPVGATHPVAADVRVLVGAGIEGPEEVLLHELSRHLGNAALHVPPLAERREDIPPLAAFFCAEAARRRRLGRIELSPAAVRALEAIEWPGNVRQLAQAIDRAVLRAAGDVVTQVQPAHVFPDVAVCSPEKHDLTFQEATRAFQTAFVREVLEGSGWNVSEAAARLDLARSHVYNLIRAFGIRREGK